MLLLLGRHNCIHGITYRVLSNIKLKWLHTLCTSPSQPQFSPSLPPVPLSLCKVHIEVWTRRAGPTHGGSYQPSSAAVAQPKEPLSFLRHLFLAWPHCSLPLGRNSFRVFSLSFISIFFPFSLPGQVFDAHLSQRQAFYTLLLTSGGQAPPSRCGQVKAEWQSFYGIFSAPWNPSPSTFQPLHCLWPPAVMQK